MAAPFPQTRGIIKAVDRATLYVSRNWLTVFLVVYGIWVLTPLTAPLLMQVGATGPANAVYLIYSMFCHQLPERSFFFFGPKPMYSLQEIARVWPTDNAIILRQFVGNAEMGWKMAWSDRMISVYGGVWLAGIAYTLNRGRLHVSLLAWILLGILPLGLDGVSHMVNDVVAGTSGIGFRDTNAWLQALTANALPASFYAGDQLGSFNSWARWITGVLFSITTVFALFPIVNASMAETSRDAERQMARLAVYDREP
jgi:uncharacterized membrane protein